MFGIADRLNQAEKLLKTNPQAALAILQEDMDEAEDAVKCTVKLGRELTEVKESLGHAAFVTKDKGKSFGKANYPVDATVITDVEDAIKRLKNVKTVYAELESHIQKLDK